ncbi:hypothetical protein GEMRC1_010305 [Eukaryota sp. GEM-RC1]
MIESVLRTSLTKTNCHPLSSSHKTTSLINQDHQLRDSISSLYTRRVHEANLLLQKTAAFKHTLDQTQSAINGSNITIERLRQRYNNAITDHANKLISEVKRLESLAISSINHFADTSSSPFRQATTEINHKRSKVVSFETSLNSLMSKSQSDFIRSAVPLFSDIDATCSSTPSIPPPPSEFPLARDPSSAALRFFALGLEDPLRTCKKRKTRIKKDRDECQCKSNGKKNETFTELVGDYTEEQNLQNTRKTKTKGSKNKVATSKPTDLLNSSKSDESINFDSQSHTSSQSLPFQSFVSSIPLPEVDDLLEDLPLVRKIDNF